MDSKIGRVALGLVVVAAAIVLFVLLQRADEAGKSPYERMEEERREKIASGDGGDSGGSRAKDRPPAVPTIVVRGGEPVGGVEKLSFDAGGQVRFAVRSDTPDELHIHGYDVERELPAGRRVLVQFPAGIEGIFEAELHGSGEQIAELRIEP